MPAAHIVSRNHPLRGEAERLVRSNYAIEYDAVPGEIAATLICRTDAAGGMSCVAGLRREWDGFFSETYLSRPVEAALSRATGRTVRRRDVFEVTTLASRAPRELGAFINDIIGYGAGEGLSWCFFTLTERLSQLVRRRGLDLILLGDADPGRLADAQAWGRYYETNPKVYGICGVAMLRALAPHLAEDRHALAL